jgi:hypothetical protein
VTGRLRVGGLDPSLTSFGMAVACGNPLVPPVLCRVRTKMTGHERVHELEMQVASFMRGCDVVAVEGAVLVAAGGGENRIAVLGLHGMVRQWLWELGIPYAVITPALRAKWITGDGGAGKDDCLAAAIQRFRPLFPGASDPDAPPVLHGNDEADALTLAAMTAQHYGQPLVPMPAARTALLTATRPVKGKPNVRVPVIEWPALASAGASLSGGG